MLKNYKKESLKLRLKKERELKNKNIKSNLKYNIKSKIKSKILNNIISKKTLGNFSSKLKINKYNIYDNNLPSNFNGFKILFITDIHLDIKPNSLHYIKNIIKKEPEYDLLVFGGDFFDKQEINKENINDLIFLFNLLKTKNNIAVLGNHDSSDLIKIENDINLKFLINESKKIKIKDQYINITGIDDITLFDSKYTNKCLIKDNSYKICISHNPDFLETSSKYYNLQLSGHTHGGQIKLPFNYILFPHTKYKFAVSGLWSYNNMKGLTSSGFGCSGFALRNIDPEIALITLNNT